MLMPLAYKILMNFISHHQYIMLLTDISQPEQLVSPPDTAHRIMRTAQDKHLHLLSLNLSLKIRKVNFIMAVLFHQRAFHQLTAITFD